MTTNDHKHEVLTSAAKKIVGGGSIALEVCACQAMRSVVTKKGGQVITSDWEDAEEEDMPLIWDGTTNNDQE
jgi:hypothetical protein